MLLTGTANLAGLPFHEELPMLTGTANLAGLPFHEELPNRHAKRITQAG